MGRKTWVKPMTLVQKLEANESVAATQCWNVACQRPWEKPHWWAGEGWYDPPGAEPVQEHSKNICGVITNQVLRDTDGDNVVDQMLEYGNGTKVCTLYADESYSTVISPSEVDPKSGEVIYWTNEYLAQTYFHKGIPQTADASHPNRS